MSNKFEFFREKFMPYAVAMRQQLGEKPRLLDVGCRGCELRAYVDDVIDYEGADLNQNDARTVRYVGDIERGLPVEDRAYQYVAALDVVEHLADPVAGLDELLRVTSSQLFVIIPNIAHIVPRMKFLFTGEISRKYDFVYPPPLDRHRWLTTQPQADEFFRRYSADRHLALETHWHLDGRRKSRAAYAMRALGLAPSLWVWSSLYVLSRQRVAG